MHGQQARHGTSRLLAGLADYCRVEPALSYGKVLMSASSRTGPSLRVCQACFVPC
jgi:hypothetical protein